MSTYVLMKVLESAALRYDRGIRLLSRGRIVAVYEAIADRVAAPGRRVLDIGCGTGGVALACAARGAEVVGIDVNADMLEVARSKPVPGDLGGRVEWLQLGAAEIEDRFGAAEFDAIVACLVFSELSPEERVYTLRAARSRLRPGGHLVIADEVLPEASLRRLGSQLARLPLVAITYAMTQTTTRAVTELAPLVGDAGFASVREQRHGWGGFAIVRGRRPAESAT